MERLVPHEPTEAMIKAGREALLTARLSVDDAVKSVYAAMLSVGRELPQTYLPIPLLEGATTDVKMLAACIHVLWYRTADLEDALSAKERRLIVKFLAERLSMNVTCP